MGAALQQNNRNERESMAMKTNTEIKKYTKKDFSSDQSVKWCPGCGDYSILSSMQTALAEIGHNKEETVFISGIGCSSRFPYYMSTYGFHGIHGRPMAVATGVKVANPKLDVWVVSGDGDSLSIGGNHFIHSIRRNIGIKYLIFNNQIYGLTKGQYSPTTKTGQITKSTPYGNIDRGFQAASLALGAEATFFARVVDTTPKDMKELFIKASQHKGTAVIEVLQNCVIFNDKTFSDITGKDVRADNQLILEHGKPMIFGANKDKGIVLDGVDLKVVQLGENGVTEKDILVHDAKRKSPNLAFMLAQMKLPEFPIPLGIFRDVAIEPFEDSLYRQINFVKEKRGGKADLKELLHRGETWTVK